MNTLCNCLIFAICHLCFAGQALALVASPTKPGPDIRWCDPIDGLSIGIEVPKGPIRFVGYSDWKGPVQFWRDHGNQSRSWHYNPGGFWDDARVTVHLRNVSDTTVYWSRRFTIGLTAR